MGGAFGNCVEAKEAGVRMGGKNDAERKDPGVRVPWINIEGNLQIYQHQNGLDFLVEGLKKLNVLVAVTATHE